MAMGQENGRPKPHCLDIVVAQPLIGRCRIGIYERVDFSLANAAINKRLQRYLFQNLEAYIASGLTGGLGCLLGSNAGYIGSPD